MALARPPHLTIEIISRCTFYPVPQGVGLGQSTTEPSQYQIGTLYGEVAATCDFSDYIWWTFCDGQRSVSDIIHATAKHLNCAEDLIQDKMIALLPVWLQTRVIGLDRPVQSEEGKT